MPARTNADGSFASEPFTPSDIAAMNVRAADVRTGNHPTETRRRDEITMTRTFYVAWGSRYDFCQYALGDSILYSDTSGGSPITKISRLIPATNHGRHPYYPQIMATRVEYLKGHGSCRLDPLGNGLPSYDLKPTDCCEAQIFYEYCPFAVRSDVGLTSELTRFTSRSPTADVQTEVFSAAGGIMKLTRSGGGGAHGNQVQANLSVTRPVQRFQTMWHYLPNALYISGGALFERLYVGTAGDGIPFIGCVNKEQIEFPGMGTYKPGQLLLEGIEDRRITSPLAEDGLNGLRWDVSFKWAFTSRGWLDFWYFDPLTPANTGYYRLAVDGVYLDVNLMPDHRSLYNCRDMSLLWSANPP
jgi:hypothetical protein